MNIESNARYTDRRSLRIVAVMLIVAAFFLCARSAIRAQGVNATLTGTATDQRGALLPDVSVRITNPETGFQREVQTSDNGTFTFPALPPATYIVSASKDGFAPAEFNNLTLNVNDNRSLRLEMRVGDVGASVDVTGETSLINNSATQATTIDRTFVDNLPINGRSFQSLIFLSPGVVPVATTAGSAGQFSVNGQRPNANYFTVDGVGANVQSSVNTSVIASSELGGQALTGTLPSYSALGTTNTLVPVDALEEFKIQTSGYSAEFGRQPGGQVQIVTRSGKSRFNGSIFDYVRNEAFDANNFFNNASGIKKPPLRQNQFGGTFGGPLYVPRFGEGGGPAFGNDKKTFFFFAYEGTRVVLPNTTLYYVPSQRIRQEAIPAYRPFLNAYPISTAPEVIGADIDGVVRPLGFVPYQSSFSNPSSSDSYGIRIDRNLTKKMTLFGRLNIAPSTNLRRSLSVLSGSRGDSRTLTLGTTYVVSSAISNDLRFNYTVNRGRFNYSLDDFGGAVPIDRSAFFSGYNPSGVTLGEFNLLTFGTPVLRIGDAQDTYNRQINIVDNFSVIKGAHNLKFGIDYRRLMPTYAPVGFARSITVVSGRQLTDGVALIQSVSSRKGAEPRINNYSFYGQDTWKVSKRLSLDLGLRYELNPAPYDANGIQPIVLSGIAGRDVSGATLAPQGTPFFKTFKTAFAPRLGAVYQLNQTAGRETVVRGGFGVFYDLGNSQALNGFNTFPFRSSGNINFAPFPLSPEQLTLPSFPTVTLPILSSVFATDSNLKLPYTLQWNLGVEQSLGKDQAVSISYVGSAGRRLLSSQILNRQPSTTAPIPNPNFRSITYTFNASTSDYNALQVQFRRRLSRGFQALVNYTWSHAIDENSDEFTYEFVRGSAGFDVRHNFSTALTYEIPTFTENRFARAALGGWSVDSTAYLQSGQPIDITIGSQPLSDGSLAFVRPDYVDGQPFWIDAPVPGGRRINPAAFRFPPRIGSASSPFARQGTFGRNVLTGPAVVQVNAGLKREFKLTERLRFQVRAEAFNVFNKPQFSNYQTNLLARDASGNLSFGIPNSTLNTSLGGLSSLYQLGGPRSFQFSGRLFF